MPYKNLEDRTEAVRRFRQKKAVQARENQSRNEKYERVDRSLAHVLDLLGFEEAPFEIMVEVYSGAVQDKDGTWHDKEGNIFYPPGHVFFGRDSLIFGNHFDDQLNALELLYRAIGDYAEDNSQG